MRFPVVLALAASAFAPGCAPAARPTATKYADATGATSCALVEDRNEPFVVDWRADKRADLEAALGKSIVVVAYDCNKLRILSECGASGSYAFAGVTEKEQLIRLVDADEVRANLPLSGGALSGKLQGSFERGATLDIALALVGKTTSSRIDIARTDLKGDCEGATHFVRSATLGAFVMRTGTRAKVAAAADLLVGSASAASSSEQQIENRDGSVEACRSASPTKDAPAPGCASPLRLQLRAIASRTAPDSVSGCGAGLVRFDDGKCGKPSAEVPYICQDGDVKECEQQCTRGSLVSCVSLGRSVLAKEPARSRALFQRACDGGVAEGCGRLGELRADRPLLVRACGEGWFPGCAGAAALAYKQDAIPDVFAAFKRGCIGGSAEDCFGWGSLYKLGLVPMNAAEQLRAYQRACEGGAKLGCSSLAAIYEQTDLPRAVALLRESCDRGASSACSALGSHHLSGKGVERDPARALTLFERACDGTDRGTCLIVGEMFLSGIGVTVDKTRAHAAFVRACEGGVDGACDRAKR